MGYSESSKAYRIYFPGFKKIDISIDITFEEDSAYKKYRKRPAGDPKEIEVPRIQGYERLSKVKKYIGLQNKFIERGKELGPTMVM